MESKISKSEFSNFFPKYKSVAKVLESNSIPFAIFSGSEVWLLTDSRKPTDLDIIVRDQDMQKTADLLSQEVKSKSSEVVSADFLLVGQVEIVSNIKVTRNGNIIAIPLTDQMIANLISLDLGGDEILPLLAPEDTIIIKSLLRRDQTQGKFDLEDIDALKSSITINYEYMRSRINELQVGEYINELILK